MAYSLQLITYANVIQDPDGVSAQSHPSGILGDALLFLEDY